MFERATITPTSAVPAWILSAPCGQCGTPNPLGSTTCVECHDDPRELWAWCEDRNKWAFVGVDRLESVALLEAVFGSLAGEIVEKGGTA